MNLKKIIAGVLCILLAISVLGGCSTYSEKETTLEVEESNLAEDIIGTWKAADSSYYMCFFDDGEAALIEPERDFAGKAPYRIDGDTVTIGLNNDAPFKLYEAKVTGNTFSWTAQGVKVVMNSISYEEIMDVIENLS